MVREFGAEDWEFGGFVWRGICDEVTDASGLEGCCLPGAGVDFRFGRKSERNGLGDGYIP